MSFTSRPSSGSTTSTTRRTITALVSAILGSNADVYRASGQHTAGGLSSTGPSAGGPASSSLTTPLVAAAAGGGEDEFDETSAYSSRSGGGTGMRPIALRNTTATAAAAALERSSGWGGSRYTGIGRDIVTGGIGESAGGSGHTSSQSSVAGDVQAAGDIEMSVDRAEAHVLGQLRALSRFRWRRYSRWEKMLLGLALLQIFFFISFSAAVYALGDRMASITGLGENTETYRLFLLVIMVNNGLWELVMLAGGLLSQNHFDLVAFYLAAVSLSARDVYEAVKAIGTGAKTPTIGAVVSVVFALLMLPLTVRVYNDVQSVRQFGLFQKVSRIRQILEIHKRYLLIVTMLKLDGFLAASLVISGYFGGIWSHTGYAQYMAPLGLVLTLISYICGIVGLRLERRDLVFLYFFLSIVEPFAIVYKMVEWQLSEGLADHTVLSKPYFFFLGALALLLRLLVMIVIGIFMRSFGLGLSDHVFVVRKHVGGSVTSTHELSS